MAKIRSVFRFLIHNFSFGKFSFALKKKTTGKIKKITFLKYNLHSILYGKISKHEICKLCNKKKIKIVVYIQKISYRCIKPI